LSGARILNEALRMGPYGTTASPHISRGDAPRPPAPFNANGGPSLPLAKGGSSGHVPVIVAGGEFIVPPDVVTRVGQGDVRKGHRTLDEMVRRVRVHTAKKIKTLPAPKK
jgi:hypothetical protein